MLPRVLITGFEPFGRRRTNRYWQCVEAFVREARTARLAHEADLAAARLPVDFVALPQALKRLWRTERPDLWILAGESGAGESLRVERVAVNLLDAALPDRAGRVRRDAEVVPGGPPAYFANLDTRRAAETLTSAGARARVSLTAGAYCCNQAFYWARHLAETAGLHSGRRTRQRGCRMVFLHIPRHGARRGGTPPPPRAAARALVHLVRDFLRGA